MSMESSVVSMVSNGGQKKEAVALQPDGNIIFVPGSRVVPYETIAPLLAKGQWAWVEGLSRGTAHAAAKRLSKGLKVNVKHSAYQHQGKKGYIFYRVS